MLTIGEHMVVLGTYYYSFNVLKFEIISTEQWEKILIYKTIFHFYLILIW